MKSICCSYVRNIRILRIVPGGYVEHKENGKDYIDSYYYMADRGWLFMINDDEDELFAAVVSVRNQLLIMLQSYY